MIKTIRRLRIGEVKEDYSWALALSDQERADLATSLTSDLWRTATGNVFPKMNRMSVNLSVRKNQVTV